MPYIPYPVDRGTYQRVYHLFLELTQCFEVDLVCLQEDAARTMEPFEAHTRRCLAIPFQHPDWPKLFPDRLLNPLPTTVAHWQAEGVEATLAEFIEGQDYERVLFVDLVLWPYVQRLFPHHPQRIMDRSRVDWLFQTEEYAILNCGWKERFLRKENLMKLARLEREAYAGVSGMVVCGEDDRVFLADKLGEAEKVFVLPNGYSEAYFDADFWPRQPSHTGSILFCGALDYSPNVDAIDWFADEIWPQIRQAMPEVIWQIVGKSPDHRSARWGALDGVELIGEVPDVRPYYQSAWLQVVPLRIGGGTRLKIVESLAMCCPVVSTRLGAQGLGLKDGEDLLLADQAAAFAARVLELLTDSARCGALQQTGLRSVCEQYKWSQLGLKLNEYIGHL